MAKKKTPSPYVIYSPPLYTAKEQEDDYKRQYEFNKPVPARSPVGGWEDKHIRMANHHDGMRVPQKEINLVKGTPHRFSNVRTGNAYSKRQAVKRTVRRTP